MSKSRLQPIWVIKIGSAMVTNNGKGIDASLMGLWCRQIKTIKAQRYRVIVVSSGAVALGVKALRWAEKPKELNKLQAAAAVGQSSLMEGWRQGFSAVGLMVGQILITHEDAIDRTRYLNIKGTITALLEEGLVPIINENDTISFDEIKIGDNDTLGAMVANLMDAHSYVILTDQLGLYNADPRENNKARLINEISAFDESLVKMASKKGGRLGTGGMYTKVIAAQMAAKSGTTTYIAKGDKENILLDLVGGISQGTKLLPTRDPIEARKRWMLNQRQVKGTLTVDKGAERALMAQQKSLLPVGMIAVDGMFERGDVVACVNEEGVELGRGLANYNCLEAQKIIRAHSHEIEERLGFLIADEMIHRNNWVEIQ